MPKKITTNEFIKKSQIVHGNKYDYSNTIYTAATQPIIIGCPTHGDFLTTPNKHSSQKIGCLRCSKKERLNNNVIDERMELGNKPTWRIGKYINRHTKIEWGCKLCDNIWMAAPKDVVPNENREGTDCPQCKQQKWKDKRKLHNEDIDARLLVQERSIIRLDNHINMNTPMLWKCLKCNKEWSTTSSKILLSGTDCPHCCAKGYSHMSIKWLESIMQKNNIFIQHAKNGGEYVIPSTRFRADGYCKENNTVYEFYGDYYHGNLNKFEPAQQCHPYNEQTAQELYNTTTLREQIIANLGYNLVTIWESDYLKS